MSVPPPWPGRPGSEPESNPEQGQAPQHEGWTQPGQYQGHLQGQGQQEPPPPYVQQPPFGQQPQGQPYPPQQPQYNAQPYYGTPNEFPGGMAPAPKKKSVLPWILAGGGLVVLAVIVAAVVLISGLFAGGNKANLVDAPTRSASFQYPEGWIRTTENVTIIKGDGSSPAEHFNAVNQSDTPSAMVVYQAGEKPTGNVTTEKIHASIDKGLSGQLAASQKDLVYFRSTSAFGCLKDFAYTDKPVIVERDGLYGYSYGYTCFSYQGKITGEYLVAYDTTGISHRMTVEAIDAEWAKNKATLTAIVDSLKPAL